MTMKHHVLAASLAAALVIGIASRPSAQDSAPCEFDGVERVVAVGDVHGAYENLVQIMQTAGIIDQRQRWSGGRAHFVQLGDVLDRGADSRKVLDLYRRLEREAASAGGRLHFMLGNHEAMRLYGDYRYTSEAEYKAFSSGGSRILLNNFLDGVADPEVKKYFASQPLGFLELVQAFGSKEPYGQFLRAANAVVRINGVVFVHGGLTPRTATLSCGQINDTIRRQLTTELEATRSEPAASLAMNSDGPLWYRGLAADPEDAVAPRVEEILKAQQARAIVVAHTPQESGRIGARVGGKVIIIDTGIQTEYVPTGRPSALELRDGTFTAIYLDGREPVASQEAVGTAAR